MKPCFINYKQLDFSYPKNRNPKTVINGIFSDPSVVPCVVPQDSSLGPLLFIIYVNDMEAAVSCQLILYAEWLCPFGFRQGCRTN